jgi:hypothetical protein
MPHVEALRQADTVIGHAAPQICDARRHCAAIRASNSAVRIGGPAPPPRLRLIARRRGSRAALAPLAQLAAAALEIDPRRG